MTPPPQLTHHDHAKAEGHQVVPYHWRKDGPITLAGDRGLALFRVSVEPLSGYEVEDWGTHIRTAVKLDGGDPMTVEVASDTIEARLERRD